MTAESAVLLEGEAANIFRRKMYVTCNNVPKLSHLANEDLDVHKTETYGILASLDKKG